LGKSKVVTVSTPRRFRARGCSQFDRSREAAAIARKGENIDRIRPGRTKAQRERRVTGVGVDMQQRQAHATAAVDPVCGMTVDPATAPFASSLGLDTIWFCCAGCKKAFDRKPGLYGRGSATIDPPR